MGPDTEAFVNFIYYNTIRTLKPGHIRYSFMLTEGGVVYDDGVSTRPGQNRFFISCSSSHVEGVMLNLEARRQDGNGTDRIFVHYTTMQWATLTLSGPKARNVLATLGLVLDISGEAFKHMSFREAVCNSTPLRTARVSFTGEVSFEISLTSSAAPALWIT